MVFGSSSSLPPLVSEVGGLVFESDLLSDHFDRKQFKEAVDLPLTCHPFPRTLMVALTNWGCFLFFLKRTVMAPRLSVIFLRLVRLGSFPACWKQANVTQITKGSPSSSLANYRPIYITSILSKVFESLLSVRLVGYGTQWCDSSTQFAYRKGLDTCDALLCVSHTLQRALECMRQEARILHINFSADFGRVNH